MKKPILLLLITLGAFFIVCCDKEPAVKPSGKTVKVGIIGPFSGPRLANGKDGLKGVEAVMDMIPLLQNGDKIELIIEDDRNEPSLAKAALEKLVVEHKVSAVLTLSTSEPVLALASVADAYQTPIIAVLATHQEITQNNHHVSQIRFDDIFQGSVAALYVRDELLLDRVAVFSEPGSSYSTNLATEFERKFTAIGGQVTDRVFVGEAATDLSKTMERLKVSGTELLYMPVTAANVFNIIQQAQDLGWHPQFMVSDGLMATVVIQHPEMMPLLDGMLATDFFHNDMPLSPFGKRVKPHIKDLKTSFGALSIEGFAILLDAMNQCNPPSDRACINNRIRSTDGFNGVLGKISIDANGRAERPLVINTILKGRMRFVVKVY